MSLNAVALTVESTAGQLKTRIDNPQSVTELILSGTVNAEDLDFIDKNMPALETLDLSQATVAAYNGKRLRGFSVHPAGKIPAGIFTGSQLRNIVLPVAGNVEIGDIAFAGSALENLTLNSNITAMGTGAFSNCKNLKSLTINTSAIGASAFADCTALTDVTVSCDLAIPDHAFYRCSSLAKVSGSDNITRIDASAFALCGALKLFIFGKNLTTIGNEAFLASGLESVNLSGCPRLESIGDWAFAHNLSLDRAALGQARELGRGLFFDCPALSRFTFSETATELPDYALAKDTGIDSDAIFIYNHKVSYIGRHALSGLSNVSELTLPADLTYIGDNAMEGMLSLKTLTVAAESVPELGEEVWKGLDQSQVDLLVFRDVADDFRNASQWQDFNIVGTDGVDDTVEDVATTTLRARFAGDILQVEYTGINVEYFTLYELDGSAAAVAVPSEGTVSINTADMGSRIFILTAHLADGSATSIKIAK
ncbi:MAG: leucine-rich repeat domain-containing protein [Muribaculaceae bacterium]|nr:leucine-rich repeat domain-containing protein [Muribaculaceae bacterium]